MYYDYTTTNFDNVGSSSTLISTITGISTFIIIMLLLLVLFQIICDWKLYKKANKQGWASIIPIYNMLILLEIVKLPAWYLLLFFVPILNIYALIKMNIELSKKFGKDTAFAIGLIFLSPIFRFILAFGKSNYIDNITGDSNINDKISLDSPNVNSAVSNNNLNNISINDNYINSSVDIKDTSINNINSNAKENPSINISMNNSMQSDNNTSENTDNFEIPIIPVTENYVINNEISINQANNDSIINNNASINQDINENTTNNQSNISENFEIPVMPVNNIINQDMTNNVDTVLENTQKQIDVSGVVSPVLFEQNNSIISNESTNIVNNNDNNSLDIPIVPTSSQVVPEINNNQTNNNI